MTIKDKSIFNQHEFEVVEKIPSNYFVWNIGENMGHDDYIPLAQDLHPGDKDDYRINQYTLKAIKLVPEEVEKLRAAASWGINNLATARKALKSKRKGCTSNKKRALAELTIEIFERITA